MSDENAILAAEIRVEINTLIRRMDRALYTQVGVPCGGHWWARPASSGDSNSNIMDVYYFVT